MGGPIDTRESPHARLRTLPSRAVSISSGFWSGWQRLNRDVSLGHGLRMLEQSGNLDNLRIAAGQQQGEFRGPVFMDSDVYKWLEAVALECMREQGAEWESAASPIIDLVAAAQQPDGYLNSYYQVAEPGRRWTDIAHGHEMYCAGHLTQAAVAWRRATGDERLLRSAMRLADHIDSELGPGRREATPGHPEIETALVEQYRETRESRYLTLAQTLVDRRGRGLITGGRYASAYYRDRVPVREASTVEGHAVRAMYLAAGVTDLYLETGEEALRAALERQWHDMVDRKMYVTGGLGARHIGESFGQPYELPNESAYCETCAAIGSVMWNWRLLLASGDGRYADEIERALFNGFLSGMSLAGDRYFYVNPLLSQGRDEVLGRTSPRRLEWWRVACCPPNVMRTLASLGHYVATSDADGVQVHQYTNAEIATGDVRLTMRTEYPWQGSVSLNVDQCPKEVWGLALRVPAWVAGASVTVNGQAVDGRARGGYVQVERSWRQGDTVEIELDMQPRLLSAHPRIESTHGCVCIQRGPIVYCLEQTDHAGTDLFDLVIDATSALESHWQPGLLGGMATVTARGFAVDATEWEGHLYRTSDRKSGVRPVELTAIPYYAWANRGDNAMRVWIPAR